MDLITELICKKNKISYTVFNQEFKIVEHNHAIEIGSDVRESMWEIVGLEEELHKLLTTQAAVLKFPMIMKQDEYYDLDIESFVNEDGERLFIAYFIQKPKESLAYINMIQEINKRVLVYESENKKDKEKHYNLINKKLLSFSVDLDGTIQTINSAFLQFFDLDESEIIGKHFSYYFKARDLTLKENTTIIFNAVNAKDEVVSFHADIIPVSEDGHVYENIIICQDITYLKQIEKELEYAAGHDSLTGLPNRSKLLRKIDKEIQKDANEGNGCSVCFVDMDNFKPVNDNYGHHAGDMLLKHVAKVLSDFVRKEDMVARIGGDEFVIFFSTPLDGVYRDKMERRLQELSKKHPLIYSEDDIIEFDFSFGIATYPQDGITAQELLQVADKKMYMQKRIPRK